MPAASTLTDKQRTPTQAVAKQAQKGLTLREQHGRGGTEVGQRRAKQLSGRHPVSERDIKDIHSYFARHAVDKDGKNWADADQPSAGYIAWLLWGGDAGRSWIDRLHARLEKAAVHGKA